MSKGAARGGTAKAARRTSTKAKGGATAKARPTPRRPTRRPARRRTPVGPLLAVGLAAVGLVAWLVFRGGGSPDPGRPVVGGDLHSIAVSPTDPNRVWVGGHQAAAASADGGVTWTQVASLANSDPMGWVIDPADPARHYVGGHPGFKVSSDGGQSFTTRNQGLPATDVHGLGRDPASGRLYAAVVGKGLLASDDQGSSWATVNPGVQTMGPILVDPKDSKRLYVSDMRNLLGSTDGGRSWQPLAAIPGAMSLAQARDGTLFAAANGTVLKSTDRGASFTALAAPPVQVLTVAVTPDGQRLYAAGHDGNQAVVVRSEDAGTTWQQVTK
jgi:DNA-binding beta-propeller fold protein YncE